MCLSNLASRAVAVAALLLPWCLLVQFSAAVSIPYVHSAPLSKRYTCTITRVDQLPAAKSNCATITIGTLEVPAGTTLNLTKLKDGTTVVFDGTVTFGYKEWTGPLVQVGGNHITVSGTPKSLLDGNGRRWWDGQGGNGGKKKPKFFWAHSMNYSTISGLNLRDSPVHTFSIANTNKLALYDITLDNRNGDDLGAHNTDAFDVSNSNDLTIDGCDVYTQDDCLAVNSGKNIQFSNTHCKRTHGISIGSIGNRSNNVVDTVTVTDCTLENSDNGIRIKTIAGAPSGKVTNINYSGITLINVTNGIVIRQDYTNKGYTGKPTGGIPITNLKVTNVQGTIAQGGTPIYIMCAKGACSNWAWKDVQLEMADYTSTTGKSVLKNVPANAGVPN